MSDACRTCGEKDTRIDAPMALKGITVEDSYCGACGVNWGVYSRTLHEESQIRKRRLLKPLTNNWRQVAK